MVRSTRLLSGRSDYRTHAASAQWRGPHPWRALSSSGRRTMAGIADAGTGRYNLADRRLIASLGAGPRSRFRIGGPAAEVADHAQTGSNRRRSAGERSRAPDRRFQRRGRCQEPRRPPWSQLAAVGAALRQPGRTVAKTALANPALL